MTLVSNDPIWWLSINSYRISSYFVVAYSAGVIYDWALTFGREVELIWRQHWSPMTILYLSVRYIGIIYVVISMLYGVPIISVGDTGCWIMWLAQNWMNVVVNAILNVIMITRLYAMYQRSKMVLILLVAIFLSINILDGVTAGIAIRYTSGEELILSGTYQCTFIAGDITHLFSVTWIIAAVWEVITLCLAVWIAVKHFRELRRQSAGGIIRDCYTVLMKTHLIYFASFLAISCYFFAPMDSYSVDAHAGLGQLFMIMQFFVLGPRLILGVREYHAKMVANSDESTSMASIVFQERVHVSASSRV